MRLISSTLLFFATLLPLAPGQTLSLGLSQSGSMAGAQLGWSVSGAGDVNGDGFADIIVGEPMNPMNNVQVGTARVYSGVDGSLLHQFFGDSPLDGFGTAVSGAGDVNGDGHADLIVGAYGDDNNGMTSGNARVFSGLTGALLFSFDGDDANDHFGYSVSGAGDVNADGHDDVVVGAFIDEAYGFDAGTVRVFSGADGSILNEFHGDGIGDRFGISVGGGGDLNGDGFADVVVGAYHDDNTGSNSGSVRVFSGQNGSILYTFNGPLAGDELGFSVGLAGDVNADGYADIVAGSPLADLNGTDSGSVRVFSGADGSLLHSFTGDDAFDHFGDKVAGAGDVNGDGFDDLVVGALFDDDGGMDAGGIQVFSGADGSLLHQVAGDDSDDWFGYAVAAAGDTNGDGFADLVIGVPHDEVNGANSGGVRILVAPTLPALKYRTGANATHGIDLSWLPDQGDPYSLTGTLAASGATPGASGLYGASLARSDFQAFGYLPLLIAIDETNLLETGNFGYDAVGEFLVPNLTRQLPPLAGYRIFLQLFEASPVIASSPGIRLEIAP